MDGGRHFFSLLKSSDWNVLETKSSDPLEDFFYACIVLFSQKTPVIYIPHVVHRNQPTDIQQAKQLQWINRKQ